MIVWVTQKYREYTIEQLKKHITLAQIADYKLTIIQLKFNKSKFWIITFHAWINN
jgi:hypothetical protein